MTFSINDCYISVCLGMPTVEEVCETFGLTDVDVEYTEADFQNLTTYKLFQQHVRPLLAKENPKVQIYMFIFMEVIVVIILVHNIFKMKRREQHLPELYS